MCFPVPVMHVVSSADTWESLLCSCYTSIDHPTIHGIYLTFPYTQRLEYLDDFTPLSMKSAIKLVQYLFTAHIAASAALSYSVPPGSPGFYHGNSTAAVTFDSHSLLLDDKRMYVFSGEVHTWRIPSGPALWRDVFQKLKVSGALDILRSANLTIAIGRRLQCHISLPPLGSV